MSNSILIVNFDFPPNAGIGGRRWAKLAKAFHQRGYKVSVLKCAQRHQEVSTWNDDVKDLGLQIFEFPQTHAVDRFTIGVKGLDSLLYRLGVGLNMLIEFGTPYDAAVGMQHMVASMINAIVEQEKISWVFCTGAPFNLTYYAALAKEYNQSFKLWVDYRDPWLRAANYGMATLSKARKQAEIDKVKRILQQADVISAPYQAILDEFEEYRTESDKAKLKILRHFYDPQDLESSIEVEPQDDFMRIVYGGEIYNSNDGVLEMMIRDLSDLKSTHFELFSKLKIEFYSQSHALLQGVFEGVSCVSIKPLIGKEIFKKIKSSNYCIILMTERTKDFFTTKFFEFGQLGTPFLYLGPKGEVANVIEDENLGIMWEDFISFIKINNRFPDLNFSQDNRGVKDSVGSRLDEIVNEIAQH
jgi:hypothetical protein